MANPYNLCVCVPKDLAKHCTGMVLLYMVASPGNVYNYYRRRFHHSPKKNRP